MKKTVSNNSLLSNETLAILVNMCHLVRWHDDGFYPQQEWTFLFVVFLSLLSFVYVYRSDMVL